MQKPSRTVADGGAIVHGIWHTPCLGAVTAGFRKSFEYQQPLLQLSDLTEVEILICTLPTLERPFDSQTPAIQRCSRVFPREINYL